nr:hypothetical protein [uncultured Agathobaculum sp.]
MKKTLREKWSMLCGIHTYTKKFFLLAEEFNLEMKTFIQPMKEQRDAYEHIVRAYGEILESEQEDDEYVLKNFDKAISHEYRAYFDALDFLTISIRERIHHELECFSYEQIVSVFPGYTKLKATLSEFPQTIANLRIKKDIGSIDRLELVKEYAEIGDYLLDIYQVICKKVLPLLVDEQN